MDLLWRVRMPRPRGFAWSDPLGLALGLGLLLLDVLLALGLLEELRRPTIVARDAERLLQPAAGLQAVAAGEALGLHRRLARGRNHDLNDPGHWQFLPGQFGVRGI